MRCVLVRSKWGRRLGIASGVAFTSLACLTPTILGATEIEPGGGIIRVEEDWEIILLEPGDDLHVPQFHTVMSPYQSQNATYFQVSWNYREEPDFQPGGLQLQAWGGDDYFGGRDVDIGGLSRDAETVTWTQSLSVDLTDLTFAITNGHSSSWGSFGGESMTVRLPRAMHSLSGYSTNVSAQGSWITYGSNRVVRLQITEVRTYNEEGLVSRNSTPRVVYQYQDGEGE